MTTERVTRCDFCDEHIESEGYYKVFAAQLNDNALRDERDICPHCWTEALEGMAKRREFSERSG